MTTYYIIHYTATKPLGNTVFTSKKFNQAELQQQFDAVVKTLAEGESVEYLKVDNKYYYPSLQYVEKEKGILYRYTPKGAKREYKTIA